MGDRLRVSCTACSFEREFRVGKGLLYKNPGSYLIESEISSKQMQNNLFQRMEGPCAEVRATREVYRCEKCNRVMDCLSINIVNGKKSYKTKYCCPRCNKTMTVVEMRTGEYPCPNCEEGTLRVEIAGKWD